MPARSTPPVAAPARRNWGALIAVPVVIILLLSCALVAARPRPHHPYLAEIVLANPGLSPALPYPPAESGPPAASGPPATSDPPAVPEVPACDAPMNPVPSYRVPISTSVTNPYVISREELVLPPCQTLVLGATAIIGGLPGQVAEVTALPAVFPGARSAPPPVPAGHQRVWFRLHIRNAGTTAVYVPYTWVWAAAAERGWIFPVDLSYPEGGWLKRGDNDINQMVAFDVDSNVRLARLRLGLAPNAVDWVLG